MTITLQPADPALPSCHTRPDLWFAESLKGRALAVHICRTHCPLLDACRKAAADLACPHAVQGGVLYGADGLPAKQQPRSSLANCPDCGGGQVEIVDTRKPPSVYDDCGSYRAYRRHIRTGERACGPCYEANRQRERDRRAARNQQPTTGPCGSIRGLQRHREAGEPPCEVCARAQREASEKAREAQFGDGAAQRERAEQVRQLAAAGLSDNEISERLGVSKRSVQRDRAAHHIPPGWTGTHREVAA